MNSETDSDDEILMLAVMSSANQDATYVAKKKRKKNYQRDRVGKHKQIVKDYFMRENEQHIIEEIREGRLQSVVIRGPLVSDREFERRNRMSRRLFDKVFLVCSTNTFFTQRADAAGLLGLSPEQKFIAALRQLTVGSAADAQCEYTGLSEFTALESLNAFCDAILNAFEQEFLRYPTKVEFKQIEASFNRKGFPGCIGAVDCSSWAWKNCPVAWHGEYKAKHLQSKSAIVRMEAWADERLRLWSCCYGWSGTHNDLNICYSSPLFHSILNGSLDLKPSPPIALGEYNILHHYFLADGVYPDWSIFATTIPESKRVSFEDIKYSSLQESARKCVERCFGVLFSRFHILVYPARAWKRTQLKKIAKTCFAFHNMIVEDRTESCDEQFPSLQILEDADDFAIQNGGSLDRLGNFNSFWSSQSVREANFEIHKKENHTNLKSALKTHMSQNFSCTE